MLVNAAFNPKLSAMFASIWVTGRFIYGSGYGNDGPKGRILGF